MTQQRSQEKAADRDILADSRSAAHGTGSSGSVLSDTEEFVHMISIPSSEHKNNLSAEADSKVADSIKVTGRAMDELQDLPQRVVRKATSTDNRLSDVPHSAKEEISPMLASALGYRELGWYVLPVHGVNAEGACSCGNPTCTSVGKHPRLGKWKENATTDPEQIRRWWTKFPNDNIGLAAGKSGIVVIDLDKYKQEFVEPDLSFDERETVTSLTGGGGEHLLYKMPRDRALGNATGDLAPGNDVRGGGGLIVLPPSNHISGRQYMWEDGYGPTQIQMQPLPQTLRMQILGNGGGHNKNKPRPTFSRENTHEQPDLSKWRLSSRIRQLIEHPRPVGFRSEADQAVITALLKEGADDDVIWSVFNSYPIGLDGKFAEKGQHRDTYLATSIANARNFLTASGNDDAGDETATDEGAPGLDSATKKMDKKRPKAANVLYCLAIDNLEVFSTRDQTPYAWIREKGRRECMLVESATFEDWLATIFYRTSGSTVGSAAIRETVSLLRHKARQSEREVFVRVGYQGHKVYLDLGTADMSVVEIDGSGWRILASSPVPFYRPIGFRPMPIPVKGGTVESIQDFLNIRAEDWSLLATWTLAALYASGPYPLLVLNGEQGTAKSTTARVLKALIDPSEADLRGQPSDVGDLMIGANRNWLLVFDNVSRLSAEVSDALCRVATGGGFAKRALYTNADEFLFRVQRPVIITGIDAVVGRSDLLDRAIVLDLPVILDTERRDEKSFWDAFNKIQPALLGAWLSALSDAIRRLPSIQLEKLPRMADFARLAVAGSTAMGLDDEEFLKRYGQNQREATELIVESSPVARAAIKFMEIQREWEGTASDLLSELSVLVSESERADRGWPQTAQKLSGQLNRLAPDLRRIGIEKTNRRSNGSRLIQLERI